MSDRDEGCTSTRRRSAGSERLRDVVLPVFLRFQGSADAQRWIFDHHIEWDAKVALDRAA